MPKTFVDALDVYMQRREQRNKRTQRGIVVAVAPPLALVNIGGSQQAQEAKLPATETVSVGDTCLLEPNKTESRPKWLISQIIGRRIVHDDPNYGRSYTELFPPTNLRVVEAIANSVTVAWDAPIGSPIVFEVEESPSADESSAALILTTRGSYAIMATQNQATYIRLRTVAPDGQRSTWSEWLYATPATQTASADTITYDFGITDGTFGLLSAVQGTLIKQVALEILTPFDGGINIQVGEPGDPDRHFNSDTDADLTIAGAQFVNFPLYEYQGDADVELIVTNTDATTGLARLIVLF